MEDWLVCAIFTFPKVYIELVFDAPTNNLGVWGNIIIHYTNNLYIHVCSIY